MDHTLDGTVLTCVALFPTKSFDHLLAASHGMAAGEGFVGFPAEYIAQKIGLRFGIEIGLVGSKCLIERITGPIGFLTTKVPVADDLVELIELLGMPHHVG